MTWRMPFGKYKGKSVSLIDPSYLRWFLRETDVDSNVEIRRKFANELGRQSRMKRTKRGPRKLKLLRKKQKVAKQEAEAIQHAGSEEAPF